MWPVDPKVRSPVRTRNGGDVMISRHVTLDVEDVDTCPRDEKTDLRGGALHSCIVSRVSQGGPLVLGPIV